MRSIGIAILLATVLVAVCSLIGLAIAPSKYFEAIDNIPVKIFIGSAALAIIGRLGWSIYRWFYLPSVRRHLYSIAGIAVPACFLSGAYPVTTNFFDAASFYYRGQQNDDADHGPEVKAKVRGAKFGWPEAVTTIAGTFFGLLASIVCIYLNFHIAKYEKQFGVLA